MFLYNIGTPDHYTVQKPRRTASYSMFAFKLKPLSLYFPGFLLKKKLSCMISVEMKIF